MSRLSHCLWFDGVAEGAVRSYVALIPDSRLGHVLRSPVAWPGGEVGDVLSVEFTLGGQPHLALNGGPHVRFNPSVSLMVVCDDQAELDRIWDGLLTGGGAPMRCGWLTDRYGLSWQVVPRQLADMMRSGDQERIGRVMAAFMPMVKLDLAAIEAAYEGRWRPPGDGPGGRDRRTREVKPRPGSPSRPCRRSLRSGPRSR